MSMGTLLRIYIPFLILGAILFAYSGLVLSPAGQWPTSGRTPWAIKCLSVGVALLMGTLIVGLSASTGLTLILFGFSSGIGFCAAAALLWVGPTPFYGFYASLLLIPLLNWLSSEFPRTLWREMFVGPFSLTPVMLLVGIAALAASLRGSGAREALRRAPLLGTIVLTFLASGLLAAFRAPDLWKGLQQWFLDGLFPFLGLFIVLQTVDSPLRWRQCLEGLILCGAGVALLGGYLFFRATPGAADIRQLYGANLSVNLPSANLAQILLLLLPVTFVLAAQASGKRQGVFAGITALFLSTILFSYSRSSAIAMLISLALLVFLPRARRGLLLLVSIVLLFAVAKPGAFKDYVLTRLAETQDKSVTKDYDVIWRMEAWHGSLQLLKEHPWGVGLGQWSRYAPSYTPSRQTKFSEGAQTVYIASPHNLFFNFGIEAGWLGLGALFLLFAGLLLLVLKRVPWPEGDDLRYGAFAGVIAYFMSAFLGANLFAYKLNILPGLLFWSFVGLFLMLHPIAETEVRA